MRRYIDAETALKIVDSYAKSVTEEGRVFVDAIRDIISTITPTADVVEVRHGKWIGISGDQCSNCGRSLRDLMDGDSYYSSEFEYGGFDALVACPFCGAKMDGGERSENGKT